LLPDPPTDVGTETDAETLPAVALADGAADVSLTWTDPIEPVALLPLPASAAVSAADAASPAIDAPTAGLVPEPPTCAAPIDPVDEFPPPTWAVPIELDAELAPLPPIDVGAAALTWSPATVADPDGAVLAPLTWTAPTEFEAVLPPPA
jgi:hypothetical protein